MAFDERVHVRKTIHHKDYSDGEMDATWYSEQEYTSFSSIQIQPDMVEKSSSNQCSSDDVLRCEPDGVEQTTKAYNRKLERSIHRESILMEQDLQMKKGNWDPEHIAEVSQQLSRLSSSVARQVARLNELSIR